MGPPKRICTQSRWSKLRRIGSCKLICAGEREKGGEHVHNIEGREKGVVLPLSHFEVFRVDRRDVMERERGGRNIRAEYKCNNEEGGV